MTDLFEPSLTDRDDVDLTARPWRPRSIVYNAFFAGILSAGALFALNQRRLGRPERFAATLAIAILLAAVLPVLLLLAFRTKGEIPSSTVRLASRLIAVAAALAFARNQTARFLAFERSGGEPASLWGFGFASLLTLGILQAAWIVFVAHLLQIEFV